LETLMDQSTYIMVGIIAAIASFIGAILGSVVRPLIDWGIESRRQKPKQQRELYQKQLEAYKPLYEKLVIMPDSPPEHYFSEWSDEEFFEWLSTALNLLLPYTDILPHELYEKIPGYTETVGCHDDCEADVRWLFKHIKERYTYLRKELKIG
jgi:hypothetical protein